MPGNTLYPTALDSFPEIGANTPEDSAGAEHDVVHANEMAAIAAIQAKVGIDGSGDAQSIDARLAAAENVLDFLATDPDPLPQYTTAGEVDAAIEAALGGGGGGGGSVPYEVAAGASFAVPAGSQALFCMPIELLGTNSMLDVSGYLIEVT